MDIAFLGGIFEKNKIDEIMNKSKSGIQFAADALQWNIIEGLDFWNGTPVTIINAPFIGSYPKHYKDIFFKQSKWSHSAGAKDINIWFLNIWGIKNIFRAIGLAEQIKKWSDDTNQEKVVIAYSVNMPFLWALRKAKVSKPDITTCLIVPDLPAHMNLNTNISFIYKLAKKIESILIEKLMKYVDTFVLLTEPMARALMVNDRPFCVIEGMVAKNDLNMDGENVEEGIKSILYTGTLNYKYGIGTLLDAFEMIKDTSYELWICGFGEAEENIARLSNLDQRIKWHGTVSRDQAVALQRQAAVLINPRPPGEEFTKYSFPSKNLEYLLSGRPVIAYKLPGIPADYDEYMFFVEGVTTADMAEKIIEVCALSIEERNKFGEKARDYVLQNKNNVVQVRKIIDMINEKEH